VDTGLAAPEHDAGFGPDADLSDATEPDAIAPDAEELRDAGGSDALAADAGPELDAGDVGPVIEIAITVDDFTRHGPEGATLTRQDIFLLLMNTLQAHNVPGAYGFVNAAIVGQTHRPLLQSWLDAGYHLGNHTFSHPNAAQIGAAAYIENIIMGEPLLEEFHPGQPDAWKTFRFTNANHGANIAERDQIRDFLADRGYRTAWTTIEWGEWVYNNAYPRCPTQDLVDALRADQLQRVDQWLDWATAASLELFGRVIPQVMTIHVGAFTAVTADEFLTHIERRNIRYISLDEALADVVYTTEPPLFTTLSGVFLNQVRNTRGAMLTIPPPPPQPTGSEICP
jgi:peptidoglycan/xylan/chitin deacetylase (PgdA/CDA1 family)